MISHHDLTVCLTNGGFNTMLGPDGVLGDLHTALWHTHHDMLNYIGLEALPPSVGWAAVRMGDDKFEQYRYEYADNTTPLAFHNTADFGADYKMLPELTPCTVAHRRK